MTRRTASRFYPLAGLGLVCEDEPSPNPDDKGKDSGGGAGGKVVVPEQTVKVEPAKPEWKPPASQDDLDHIINKAVARAHAKYADYDDLKDKATKHDALQLELSSETDKQVRAAREEERSKVAGELRPLLVRAKFEAAAKGVLSDAQLDSLLEDMDLSRYVTDKGAVDGDRISKKVAAFAPAEPVQPAKPGSPDLGQGRRTVVVEKGLDAGLARYAAQHGKRAPLKT